MKRLVVIAITIMLGLANIPMPASADIVVDKDGGYELTDLIISEVSSNTGQRAADCLTTYGDFVEIYAAAAVDLSEYQLSAKQGNGTEKTIDLPAITLLPGEVVVTGCVENSNNDTFVNILQSGELWLRKGALLVDHVTYDTMGSSQSRIRDICDDEMVLTSNPSPGSFNANVECDPIPDPEPQYCNYLIVSELDANEKWVEIYNSYPDYVYPENLENCSLRIQSGATKIDDVTKQIQRNYQTAVYRLADYGEIAPGEYMVINVLTESEMTMAASSGIKDRAVIVRDLASFHSMGIYNYHKAGTSWSFVNQTWLLTYAPTPGNANVYQKFQTCEAGKHINEATGNCVKDPEPPAECAEGQYRNPETGRCKKYPEEKVLAECPEGQYRNPLTNRCKKYATTDDLVPCAEGYERNPETNRCRKIRASGDAEYSVEPMGVSTENNTWAIIGAAGLGVIGLLIILQFRHEIARGFAKLFKWKK